MVLHGQCVYGDEKHQSKYGQCNSPAQEYSKLFLSYVARTFVERQVDAEVDMR